MTKFIFETHFDGYSESFVIWAHSPNEAWAQANGHHRNIGGLILVGEF